MLNLAVTLLEPLNTTGSVNQFLLASKERMAGRADLCKDLLAGGACLKVIATGTLNHYFVIHWMDSFFHLLPPDSCSSIIKLCNDETTEYGIITKNIKHFFENIDSYLFMESRNS